jgi:octaprenyl-diphosphate synthase
VHDDVVDEAATRRGFFSINALWKNKIAVLVGDYLLSKGLLLSLNNGDYQILQILSTAVKEMSEGEILQLEKSRKLNLDEKVYYDIIKGKTASLLAASCAAGAASTTTDEARIADMRKFGELLGMAFQIKDDLFDYGSANVGKPTGNDIKEKKLTLPLIYTLNKVDDATKRALIYKIKNKNKDKAAIKEIIQAVVENGGIAYAEHKMEQYKQEAKATLAHQPEGEVKDALLELVEFVTNRNF